MSIRVASIACCLTLATIFGCDNSNSSKPVDVVTVSPEDQIKGALQSIVDNKAVGSEVVGIEANIAKLSGDKAAELKKDLDELQGLSGAQAAAKAKAMIGKL